MRTANHHGRDGTSRAISKPEAVNQEFGKTQHEIHWATANQLSGYHARACIVLSKAAQSNDEFQSGRLIWLTILG
jgi:hypothetical protein